MKSNLAMLILWIFIVIQGVSAQSAAMLDSPDWTLKKNKDGIKVYLRAEHSSEIKELKIELFIDHPIEAVIRALDDLEAGTEWIYACKEVKILERPSKDEVIYYTRIAFPWPFLDRDAVIRSINHWEGESFVSKSQVVPSYKYKNDLKSVVRMPQLDIEWRFTKIHEGRVHLKYLLKSDPGGLIPTWLIHLALDNGPVQTMKGFVDYIGQLSE